MRPFMQEVADADVAIDLRKQGVQKSLRSSEKALK
jgi:hypothetical protein